MEMMVADLLTVCTASLDMLQACDISKTNEVQPNPFATELLQQASMNPSNKVSIGSLSLHTWHQMLQLLRTLQSNHPR